MISFLSFIYGGSQASSSNPDDLSKVYILTLPAFHWIQVPDSSPLWRADHHCSVIGNRHMLSVGGIQDNAATEWESTIDPWPNGLGIFDMTALNWTDSYDAGAAPYEAGGLVKDFYATNAKFPSAWGNSALEVIFGANATSSPSAVSSSSSNTSNATSNPSPNTSSSNSTSNSGNSNNSANNLPAIVSGVIAGIVALAVISALLIWRWRRAKKCPTTQDWPPPLPWKSRAPIEMYAGRTDGPMYHKPELEATGKVVLYPAYELPG
jgi:hypothetical protein